ncbi:MAG: response regulator [Aquidulcibacter sp.]|jgi:CheY-like chemotaxis protein|uniref:response regulator n=1 Tax=Aquidulcibacter sp. TaxID=2052990 RepID=UPI0022C10AA6|nr:response regulator [Aquidulcibacter sp.]
MTETRVQDFANKRVLLVDDHTHIRAIFTSILNGLGMFRLSTADRSDRALSTLEAEPIDLVITDFNMPGLSGMGLAQRIRQEIRSKNPRFNPSIPIIMITSFGTKKCLMAARDAGVDEFLAKPFTTLAVAERIDSAINMQRSFIVSDNYIGPCRRRKVDPILSGLKRREADRIAILNEFGVERNLIQDDAQILIDLAGNNQIEETSTEDIAWIGENTAAHAQKIRDDLLERAAMSLLKYAALASAQGKLEADIVEMHGYAVKQLLDLAGKDLNLSNQVVDSLERAVTKRTRLRSVA